MSAPEGTKQHEQGDSEIAVEEERPGTRHPPKYAVLLHNDNYTTMEFVIEVLQTYFGKNYDDAMQVMLKVHNEGRGVAGIYSFEIAETKVDQVTEHARSSGHPLKCTLEEVS
jgi:ATP-dependent Clp protease adaptor protein ClpS